MNITKRRVAFVAALIVSVMAIVIVCGLAGCSSFAGWQGGFSESDKSAMAESLNTIRTDLVQPFGANADAKRRDSKCVTDVEFDRAVMVVLSTALAMWLSGALDKTPCVGGAE